MRRLLYWKEKLNEKRLTTLFYLLFLFISHKDTASEIFLVRLKNRSNYRTASTFHYHSYLAGTFSLIYPSFSPRFPATMFPLCERERNVVYCGRDSIKDWIRKPDEIGQSPRLQCANETDESVRKYRRPGDDQPYICIR